MGDRRCLFTSSLSFFLSFDSSLHSSTNGRNTNSFHSTYPLYCKTWSLSLSLSLSHSWIL